jgi:hypothetical protein
MLANPEETSCSAHANSRNGATHRSTDTTARCTHTVGARGNGCRTTTLTTPRVTAPATSRPSTTCAGDSPSNPTLMNKKLAPHVSPRSRYCPSTDLATLPVLATTHPPHSAPRGGRCPDHLHRHRCGRATLASFGLVGPGRCAQRITCPPTRGARAVTTPAQVPASYFPAVEHEYGRPISALQSLIRPI